MKKRELIEKIDRLNKVIRELNVRINEADALAAPETRTLLDRWGEHEEIEIITLPAGGAIIEAPEPIPPTPRVAKVTIFGPMGVSLKVHHVIWPVDVHDIWEHSTPARGWKVEWLP